MSDPVLVYKKGEGWVYDEVDIIQAIDGRNYKFTIVAKPEINDVFVRRMYYGPDEFRLLLEAYCLHEFRRWDELDNYDPRYVYCVLEYV